MVIAIIFFCCPHCYQQSTQNIKKNIYIYRKASERWREREKILEWRKKNRIQNKTNHQTSKTTKSIFIYLRSVLPTPIITFYFSLYLLLVDNHVYFLLCHTIASMIQLVLQIYVCLFVFISIVTIFTLSSSFILTLFFWFVRCHRLNLNRNRLNGVKWWKKNCYKKQTSLLTRKQITGKRARASQQQERKKHEKK